MSDRLAGWWAQYVAPVVRRWFGDRESRRCLELRVQALRARAEDDSRRLQEQRDVILRLGAILREHAAQATADAAEEARIRQVQVEIRRLAELRRQQRARGLHRSDGRVERTNRQGLGSTLKRNEPTAPGRESNDALLQALRESLKRDRPL